IGVVGRFLSKMLVSLSLFIIFLILFFHYITKIFFFTENKIHSFKTWLFICVFKLFFCHLTKINTTAIKINSIGFLIDLPSTTTNRFSIVKTPYEFFMHFNLSKYESTIIDYKLLCHYFFIIVFLFLM